MKNKLNEKLILSCLILSVIILPFVRPEFVAHASNVSIELSVGNTDYFESDTVIINGTLLKDGAAANGLIGIEVRTSNGIPLLRTIETGDTNQTSLAEIAGLYLSSDSWGIVPISSVKAGDSAYLTMTIRNNLPGLNILAGWAVYDNRMTLLGIEPQQVFPNEPSGTFNVTVGPLPIPRWAYPGTAMVVGSLFSDLPHLYGTPYCMDFSTPFTITDQYGSVASSSMPSIDTSQVTFRLPSDPVTGTYTVNASSSYQALQAFNGTAFSVQIASLPPQASFTYSPPKPSIGTVVHFDASSSVPNGGSITNYTWEFGDGNKTVTTSDTIDHVYQTNATYIVTLNVTDTDGLWSTTSKPLTIYPPYGPTANFTYSPTQPFVGAFMTFDASTSIQGWNGTYNPPITRYIWNFGDGTPEINITNPKTNHIYNSAGLYNVTLKITDAIGESDNATQQLNVVVVPIVDDIAITDLTFISPAQQGWLVNITVAIYNNGTTAETFQLEVYLNTTIEFNETITNLAPLETRNKIYILNTNVLSIGSYTITANATQVPSETNIQNNVIVSPFTINMMGDVTGDGLVDSTDLGILGLSWNTMQGDSNFNVQCDLNQDGTIDSTDLGILGINWGRIS